MYWYSVAGLPVVYLRRYDASFRIDSFSKAKGMRLGILGWQDHLNAVLDVLLAIVEEDVLSP